MATHFSSDPNISDTNAIEFARSLQIAAEGHALWHPSAINEYGGVEGDCGYFEGGRFQALFSVYDPPPDLEIPAIAPPQGRDNFVQEILNQNDILRSSEYFSVDVEANLQLPPLPQLPSLTFSMSGGHSEEEERSAFLAFGGSSRVVHADRRIKGFQQYLLDHGDTIEAHYKAHPFNVNNLVIVYQSTRCMSWWSGISYRRATSSHGQIGAEIAGVGGSAQVAVVRSHNRPWLSNRGPESWDNETQPGYSIVLRTVAMKKRSLAARLFRSILARAGHNADGDKPNTGPPSLSPTEPSNRTSDAVTPVHRSGGSASNDVVDSTVDDTSESSPLDDEDSPTELIAAQDNLLDQALEDALLKNPELDVVVGDWDVVLRSGIQTLSVRIDHSGKQVVGRLTDASAERKLQTPIDEKRVQQALRHETSYLHDKQKGGRHFTPVNGACNECRNRKYECDGSRPICSACAQRHTECTWTQEEDGRRPATKAQVDAMSMEISTLKLDKERADAKLDRLREAVAQTGGDPEALALSSPNNLHGRSSSLSIQIPHQHGQARHTRALSLGHSPTSVTSSLPSPSLGFAMAGGHFYRGSSPDTTSSMYLSTDDEEHEPRSAFSDPEVEGGFGGEGSLGGGGALSETDHILGGFENPEWRSVIGEDEGLLAIGGSSPIALSCSPPHTPARSRASSRSHSFSTDARPNMNAFRFPNASQAGPTPHNSLSGAGMGDEDEHNPECPCEWNRHLPQDVQMQLMREEHDAVLVEYFAYSVGWGMRVVRGRFMRDMRACLGGGEDGATAFYSPALHCAILADAGAFTPLVPGASILVQPEIRTSLASHARALAELELASSGRALVAAVTALAVLARYHLAQPRGARVAYGLFGMAVRVASASGYGLDCGELVHRGRVSEEERWERDWCWASLGVQDVDISLHVGQDLSLSLSSSTARPSPPALLTSLPEADGIHFQIFLASLPLLSLARRLALPAPLTLPEVASLQTELAKWHADLPDALQLHRTSSSSAPPGIYMLHMCHWWITILLHRGFYGGGSGSGSEDSVKFIDDASRKILRTLTTYDRLYTYRRAPLSAAQMAFVAGAAALMRADAAHAGALKKRREGLEAVGTAVNALRGMSLAWPCAAAYADALESRMPLVGRQERSPMPAMRHLSSGSISDHLPMSIQTLHTPNHSIGSVPVPAVVVNHNDNGVAQLQSLTNPFGGPAAMQIDFAPPS